MSIEHSKQISLIDSLLTTSQSERCEKAIKYFISKSDSIATCTLFLSKFLESKSNLSSIDQGKSLEALLSTFPSKFPSSPLVLYSIHVFTGDYYKNLQDYLHSVRFYEKALNSMQEINIGHKEELSLKTSVIECYYNIQELEKVFHFFDQVEEIVKNIDLDLQGMKDYIKVLNIVAFVKCRESLWRQAVVLLEKAKEFIEKIDEKTDVLASGLNNLALCYFNLADYQKASGFYEKSREVYEKILLENDFLLVTINLNLGICFCEEALYDRAVDCLKLSKKLLKKYHENPVELHKINVFLSISYYYQSLESKTMNKLLKILKSCQNPNLSIYEVRLSLYLMGFFTLEEKYFEYSLNVLQQSQFLFETYIKTSDIISLRTSLHVGEIYLNQNKLNESLYIFETCLDSCNSHFSENSQIFIKTSLFLGCNLILLQSHSQGMEHLNKAMKKIKKETFSVQVYFLQTFQRIFELLHNEKTPKIMISEESFRIYQVFTSVNIKMKIEVLVNLLVMLDWLHFERNEMEKCIHFLYSALDFIRKFSMFPALLSDFHEKIAVRFLIKGDYLKFLQEIRNSLKFSTDLMKKENICFQVCNCFDLIQDEAIISEFILENLEILKKASGETRIILAETCKGLGEKFEYQEKFEFSLQFFHLSLDFQLNLKNFSELKLGKLNISIGNVYFKMNKIQESNFYFNKGSQILLKLSKTSFNLDFYVIIIKKLLNLNRFSEAIIWITYSITLCKKHQLLNRDSYFLYLLLSICYEMTENLQLSERSLLNSIDLLETKPGPILKEESLVYEKLADLYTKQKKLPEALKMLKKAKNLQKSELSQNQSIFWILRKTIRCLLILKNYQKAYKNLLTLKNSSKVLIPSNSPEIFAVDFEIGESLLGLEKIGEATELIKKTLTAAITSLPSSHPYLAYGRDLLLKALSWKSSNCQ